MPKSISVSALGFAIRRPGRFDLVVQIMPPNVKAKLAKWDKFKAKLHDLDLDPPTDDLDTHLSELTFLEFANLVDDLDTVTDADELKRRVEAAHGKGTLNQKVKRPGKKSISWAELSKKQRNYIRIPAH